MMKLLNLAIFAVLGAATVYGQAALATITGTVSDPTGAVVANVPITVRNVDNGTIFAATSTDTGNYTVSQLPIGDYDLTIGVAGFKTYTHSRFHLAAGQTMREDVRLDVGQTTEAVTVTAESSLLKTETTDVSQNVTLSQLNNLPVLVVGSTNSGFRDPFASARLVPGVRYLSGANSGSGTAAAVTFMTINGTPTNTYQTRLDGMTDNPTGPRLLGAQQETQPSVDAIEEVAIQTSSFAAEFGAAGGAMINMQTKSGTNAFHGSGYDYGVNEWFNAHQPYTGLRNKIRQTDYGFTFGGPVRIPKVYNGTNKTFFFFSYEQFRQVNALNLNASVPSDAYRLGDFSGLITAENRLITTATGNAVDSLGRTMQSGTVFNPASQRPVAGKNDVRDPYVNNQVPVNLFDPVSIKVMALIPKPKGVNFDKGLLLNNYNGLVDTSRHSNLPSIKLDQNLGSKGRLSFYLQETNTKVSTTPTGADPLPDPISGSVLSQNSGTTVRLNYDFTVTPRLLLHVGVGWNDSDFALETHDPTYDAFKQLGLVGQTEARYFPRLTVATSTNEQIGGLSSLGSGFPTASFERRPSGNASATYVTGPHTIKLGMDYRLEKFPNYVRSALGGNTAGIYTFGANMTEQPSLQGITTNQGFDGFELASFLLGGVSLYSGVAPTALSNSKTQAALFVQDTWKVTRKLTLDYGVRWDYGTYAHEQHGRNGSVGLAIPNPSAAGRLGANQFEATCNCKFAVNYPFAIGPRLGVAYQINTKTVLRAGVGVVYNATATNSGSSSQTASGSILPNNSGQIAGLFKDGIPASVHAVWPSFDPAVGQGPGTVVIPTLLDPNAGRPARLLQWNIGLQREINRNLVVDASYVANRGVWWTASGLATLNALSEPTLRAYGFNDFSSPTEAALLTATVASLATNTNARTTLANRGITGFPYSNFPATQTVRSSLVAYPQFTGSGLQGSPLGVTWYDSLQVSVTQRFSHGFAFNVNYNWAKNLDLMSSPDVFNRSLGKNLSGNDLPHQFRFTAQYQVPVLEHSGVPFLSNKIASYALSDWGLGAALSYQSAPLLGRPSSNGTTPISQFLGRGPGSATLKKDANGDQMNPWSIDWTDLSGTHHTDPLDINCHCFDPTKTDVFNPTVWENIPNGQWGAEQSSYRFFRGVRIPQESLNFSRNFRFKERVTLNVRVEFTNIFNRLQMPNPSTAGNFATVPTKTNDAQGNFLRYSGGFGTFSVVSGTSGQRTGTYVARITF